MTHYALALEPIAAGAPATKRSRERLASSAAAERLLRSARLRRPAGLSKSHSGRWAAAACAQGTAVGVDVERIEARDVSWLSIAFHASERADGLDQVELTRRWTIKEAVLKLLGLGLTVDLWDVRLAQKGKEEKLELHGGAQSRWKELGRPQIRFETQCIDEDHLVTVAYGDGSHLPQGGTWKSR